MAAKKQRVSVLTSSAEYSGAVSSSERAVSPGHWPHPTALPRHDSPDTTASYHRPASPLAQLVIIDIHGWGGPTSVVEPIFRKLAMETENFDTRVALYSVRRAPSGVLRTRAQPGPPPPPARAPPPASRPPLVD